MKTAIQQLIEKYIEKYTDHLKHDDDLEQMSGKDILKIVLVDLISYQVKEKEQIKDAFGVGCQVESTRLIGYQDMAEQYYSKTFKKD